MDFNIFYVLLIKRLCTSFSREERLPNKVCRFGKLIGIEQVPFHQLRLKHHDIDRWTIAGSIFSSKKKWSISDISLEYLRWHSFILYITFTGSPISFSKSNDGMMLVWIHLGWTGLGLRNSYSFVSPSRCQASTGSVGLTNWPNTML